MFVVIYEDDLGGVCSPMAWDEDCEGALTASATSIALFETRWLARRAIQISRRFALLQQARGKPANTDFLKDAKHLRVIPATKQGA